MRGQVFLIDAGPSYEKAIKPYLQSKGIRKITGVWISHFDWDHIEGAMSLLQDGDFEVENWYLPAGEVHKTDAAEQIERLAKQVYYIKAGDEVRWGRLCFQCLSPSVDYKYKDANSGSMVLKVTDGRTGILFCADADKASEEYFAGYAGQCDILKVGHHGSSTSTSEYLLDSVQPALAVISCDRDSSYGHPHEETTRRLQEAGIQMLVTDDVGAVLIRIQETGWYCLTGKEEYDGEINSAA